MSLALLPLLLLAFSVSIDNFFGAVGIGITQIRKDKKIMVLVLFTFFGIAMPIVGLETGSYFSSAFLYDSRYVGAILLFALGAWSIAMAKGKNKRNVHQSSSHYSAERIAIIAFMLSIDNLIIGFAFGPYNLPLLLVVAAIAAIGMVLIVIGLEVGRRLGKYVAQWQDIVPGVILMLLSLFVLLT